MSGEDKPLVAEDDEFIQVVEKEDAEVIEFAKEDNNTVLLKTLQTQFPDAIGLKYKGPTGAWRAIKEEDDALLPPKDGWGGKVFIITLNNKRKAESANLGGEPESKVNKSGNLAGDLAVIGLPYETKAHELKAFIEEKYGALESCTINIDKMSGKSKGFGFVRFKDEESAKAAIEGENFLHGRKFFVRQKIIKPMKLFVNGLPQGTTQEDVNSYFSQFGNVTDCYVPKDFKGFAFFTYSSSEDAINVLKEKHTLNGNLLRVKKRQEAGSEGDGRGNFGGPSPYAGRGRGGDSYGMRGGGGSGRGRGGGGYGGGGYGGYGGGAGAMKPSAEQLKGMLFDFLTN